AWYQAAIDRRSAAILAKRLVCGVEGIRRLSAGNLSASRVGKTCAGSSVFGRAVPVAQMLISIAPVDDNVGGFSAVASMPAVNSFRTKRSRSTQGGRSK